LNADRQTHGKPGSLLRIRSARRTWHARDRWQLVLQIDSDTDVGMQWGDLGRIYVCIRKSDLAERRFDRCWTMWQCT
jgi:uncharacterized protein YwqG